MLEINLIGTEIVITMKPQTQFKKKKPVAKQPSRPLPDQYICIDPDEAPQVVDWLNGAEVGVDKEAAEIHLRLCFHCQEMVASLMTLNEKFRESVRRCLHPINHPAEERMKADKVQEASVTGSGAFSSDSGADKETPFRSMKVGGVA